MVLVLELQLNAECSARGIDGSVNDRDRCFPEAILEAMSARASSLWSPNLQNHSARLATDANAGEVAIDPATNRSVDRWGNAGCRIVEEETVLTELAAEHLEEFEQPQRS